MLHTTLTRWLILIPSLLMATYTDALTEEQMAASRTAALEWLKLVDAGRYGDSWETASLVLKVRIPKASWEAILSHSRKPYGNVMERTMVEQRPAVDPQGLPKGDYMVMLYKSSFGNAKTANELVTLVLADDGQWRAVTYLLKELTTP